MTVTIQIRIKQVLPPPSQQNNNLSTSKSGATTTSNGNESVKSQGESATKAQGDEKANNPNQQKYMCEDSGGRWNSGKCQCMNGFQVDDEGKCVSKVVITAPDKSGGNNPNMLKNVVERDIEKINATTASLGAKIYVSGYPSRQVPGDLGWKLVDAYTDFNTRCSELGEEYSSRAVDDRATGFGEDLDLNMIVTDQTPFVLSECWCFTEGGYQKEGNKCIKK